MTRIDPIRAHIPITYPQQIDVEPRTITRVDQQDYYEDTIGSATDKPFGLDDPFTVAARYAATPDSILFRPTLERPDPIDKQTVMIADAEFNKITSAKDQVTTQIVANNVNREETELLKLLIACMKVQREGVEADGKLSLESVRKNQKANNEIQKDFFKKYDDLIERTKTSEKLGWVNKIMTGALFVLGVIGLGLTIATGGAALPLVLTVTGGILAISSGSITITQSVLDFKSGKQQGMMFELKAHREMNQEKINKGMHEMQQSVDFVAQNWKQLRKILDNIYQTSLQTIK